MANSHDFFVRLAPVDARSRVGAVLEQHGFRVASNPDGSLRAERGSVSTTLLLGGFSGRSFHTLLRAEVFMTPEGGSVIRLTLNTGKAAMKGGALGVFKANRAFEETANIIHGDLASTGHLTGSVAN